MGGRSSRSRWGLCQRVVQCSGVECVGWGVCFGQLTVVWMRDVCARVCEAWARCLVWGAVAAVCVYVCRHVDGIDFVDISWIDSFSSGCVGVVGSVSRRTWLCCLGFHADVDGRGLCPQSTPTVRECSYRSVQTVPSCAFSFVQASAFLTCLFVLFLFLRSAFVFPVLWGWFAGDWLPVPVQDAQDQTDRSRAQGSPLSHPRLGTVCVGRVSERYVCVCMRVCVFSEIASTALTG